MPAKTAVNPSRGCWNVPADCKFQSAAPHRTEGRFAETVVANPCNLCFIPCSDGRFSPGSAFGGPFGCTLGIGLCPQGQLTQGGDGQAGVPVVLGSERSAVRVPALREGVGMFVGFLGHTVNLANFSGFNPCYDERFSPGVRGSRWRHQAAVSIVVLVEDSQWVFSTPPPVPCFNCLAGMS